MPGARGTAELCCWAIARGLLCILLVMGAHPGAASSSSSYELYRSGKVREARAKAQTELASAESQGSTALVWRHLMHVAWLEESVGEHRKSMQYATRALDLASTHGDPFMVGRSLCWLGWSATSLGLYPLALELYGDAIETATDGGSVIRPMIWGLATQETGSLLAKMGDLDKGAALIAETTDYARRNDILVGVAEGGAHLAAIALVRGDLEEADQRAEEALLASERCDCSAYNTNRARVILARVALERARANPKFRSEAEKKIRVALAHAQRVSDRRHIAESRLLLSYAIDADDLERRQDLVASAAEMLDQIESELRGTADAQLGALFLESDQLELAEVYLRGGFELNEELMRKVDNAYIMGDLATHAELTEGVQGALEILMEAAERAEEVGAWPLAADNQERVAENLHSLGFLSLSLHWSEKAIGSLERLLETARDTELRDQLARRKLRLSQRMVEMDLALGRAPLAEAGP